MLESRPSQTDQTGLNMELSVVILNWNAAQDTIRCVRRLSAWRRLQPTIWVVDNASTDGSVELIAGHCPEVNLICNQTNLGFAEGTNQGVRQALNSGSRPILLLNNDAVIDEADALRLLRTLEGDETIGFVGPLLFDAEQRGRLISAGGKNPVLHHQTRLLEYDSTQARQPVECISGTVIMIRAEVFQVVGLLDEAYFFSTELADLCRRGQRQGYLCLIDSRARAYHAVERSANFRETLYIYYIIRNRFIYIRKFYRYLLKGLLTGFWGSYGLALSLKLSLSGKSAPAKAVFWGVVDGVQGRFGGQNERVLAMCHQNTAQWEQTGQAGQLP